MSGDDSSSDSEIEFKRKLVLMQFVPADNSDEYEIVDDPLSDNEEEDKVVHDRYDNDIELQKMQPVARVTRAYNIRGYPEHRKEEILKDQKWHCRILDGENRIYEATNQSRYIAYHLAAIHFMKDLIKQSGTWMTQLGLPNDSSRCYQILDDKFKELESKSKEIAEIGGKNPISFLNEFCSFYKSKITIKEAVYKCKEDKSDSAGKPQFCCIGNFRGQEYSAIETSKQDAKTEIARMFVEKLKEKDEIRPFIEDQEILKRGRNFKQHVLFGGSGEDQRNFDQCFESDPYQFAVECNGCEPEIQTENEKKEVIITGKGRPLKFTTDSIDDAKKTWAHIFLRKAFVDRCSPDFFEKHLPPEMIQLLNGSFHEITLPEPWENEKR